MLQNNPIRTLHVGSDRRVAQQPQLDPIVFDGPVSITAQPRAPQRVLLPVSTIEQSAGHVSTFIPAAGYDFLTGLPSVHIEQTVEFNEALTDITSENRYIIRSPLGDAIYAATESSTKSSRLIWGSARPFRMHLLDKTHQEALMLQRGFALGAMCCQAQSLEVWLPPGNLLGRIVQSPAILTPAFYIEDGDTGEPIFRIEGPPKTGFCCFCLSKDDSFFRVHSGGEMRASIDRKWSPRRSQYTTNIYFGDSRLTARERALVLSAAFLLEYMYFQS